MKKSLMKGWKSVKLSPLQAKFPEIPVEFHSGYRSPQVEPIPLIADSRHSSGSNSIIQIPKFSTNHHEIYRQRALKQKREIMSWLAIENPSPIELLKYISTCNTPYSNLLRRTIEELGMQIPVAESEEVDLIKHDSAIESAKTDIGITQYEEKMSKLNERKEKLLGRIRRKQDFLSKLNKETELLHRLIEMNGLNVEPPKTSDTSRLKTSTPPIITTREIVKHHDDDAYNKLWTENQEIQDMVDALQARLDRTRADQLEAIRDYSMKKVLSEMKKIK